MWWLLVPAALAVQLRGDCAAQDCAACVSRPGCGWCAVEKTCRAGTASGALRGPCLWEFDRCSAGDEHPCEARTSCQDCTGDEACGWCASSGRCLDGGGAGPSGGTCVQGMEPEWVHTRGLRPACAAQPYVPETDEIVASANAREAQAKAAIAARLEEAKKPCPTTPEPTTPAPTTPAPTEPPVKTTHYYFVTNPPMDIRPMPPINITMNASDYGNASAASGNATSLLGGNATSLLLGRHVHPQPSAAAQWYRQAQGQVAGNMEAQGMDVARMIHALFR